MLLSIGSPPGAIGPARPPVRTGTMAAVVGSKTGAQWKSQKVVKGKLSEADKTALEGSFNGAGKEGVP